MSAAGPYLRRIADADGSLYGYSFWCPGCEETHQVRVGKPDRPCWGFNENLEAPTFTPSVLVTTGHYMEGRRSGDSCYCNTPPPDDDDWGWKCARCHIYVTDGRIQFLSDCTHALAGQTVPMVPIPEGET